MPDLDLAEAQRQFDVCNSCRYCEGYCAVFPAMERHIDFTPATVGYLANLCHDCRGCYQACMYTAPHEFAIDIPRVMSAARAQTYRRFAWPQSLAGVFDRPLAAPALVAAGTAALILCCLILTGNTQALWRTDRSGGSFYRVVPWIAMVIGALGLSFSSLVAFSVSLRSFARETSSRLAANGATLVRALWDGIALTYLRGGGGGCFYPQDDRPSFARRRLHLVLVLGVASAFVSTCLAAVYQELLHRLPPYPVFSLPVLFGTVGGIAMAAGASGLLSLKARTRSSEDTERTRPLDVAFLVVLDAVALTGLALLAFRSSPAMGPILIVHLSAIAGLFATAPYGKLVHAGYRLIALATFHGEEATADR
jgi:citrate/tricarballylate utilization protein